MTIWDDVSKLFGVKRERAEDVLSSERAAKHVLTRRSFFGVGAAMTAGAAVYSFGSGEVEAVEKTIELAVPDAVKEFRGFAGGATGCIYLASGADLHWYGTPTGMPVFKGRLL